MKSRLFFLYIISAILGVIVVCLIIFGREEKFEEIQHVEKVSIEELASKDKIALYDVQNDKIRDVDLKYYLYCVTASEIPFKYEIEAIKAQVIVARTYLYNKIINDGEENADVCTDYKHCQAFNELDKLEQIWKDKGFTDEEIAIGERKIKEAVEDTDGIIITYQGKVINALFHASSPIRTEDAKAIWSNEDIPYLKSVENEEDLDYERRNSKVSISFEDFKNVLVSNSYIESLSKEEFSNIHISEYTQSERVKSIEVGNTKIKAEDLRQLFGLNSTLFTMEISDDSIEFNVLGFGHGVGMSQVGANHYAKEGYTYEQIIHHYYTDVDIENVKRGEI